MVREAQGTATSSAMLRPLPTPHPTAAAHAPTIPFRVVLRKGGREDRSKEVQIPATSGIAAAVQAKAAAEADERALMKRLVLEASAREEEDGRGGGTSGRARGVRSYVSSYGGRGGYYKQPPRL